MWEIYTIGGGEFIVQILNGVVALTGNGEYVSMMRIAAIMAVMFLTFAVAFGADLKSTVMWYGSFFIVYNLVFLPKVDVHVTDRINPNLAPAQMANVPYGLAALAGLISHLGDGMTRMSEEVYALPDDLQYHNSGLIFGSQLLQKTMEFKVVDSEFMANLNGFNRQCVFYDILLNRYSIDDLKRSPDIWEFVTVTNTPSIYRSFVYRDTAGSQIVTCQAGAIMLSALWDAQVDEAVDTFASGIYPREDPATAKTMFLATLPVAGDYLMNLSQTATQMLQQTMMINAIHYSIKDMAAATGSQTALQVYADARANAQTEASYRTIARQAGEQISRLKIIFEGLYYGSFPFVFLLMLLPNAFGVFKNYAMGLVWLNLWGPMNAILHLFMMNGAREATLGISTIPGAENALTLVTHGGIAAVNADIATTAGFFASAIPFIALMLTKSGVSSFGSLATSYLNISHGSAQAAATDITTGNMSLGNSSSNQHSYDNVSANKINTNTSIADSGFEAQSSSGARITAYSGGNHTIDRSSMVSNMGDVSANYSKTLSSKLSQDASYNEQLAKQDSIGYSNSLNEAYDKTGQMINSLNHSEMNGTDYRSSLSMDQNEALKHYSQSTKKFAESERISEDVASDLFLSASLSKLGVSGGGSVKGSYASNEVAERARDWAEQNSLHDDISKIQSIAKQNNVNITDSEGNSYNQSINASLRNAQSYDESYREHTNKALSFNKAASQTQDNSASINRNVIQEYVEWLPSQPYQGKEHEGPMGQAQANDVLTSSAPTKGYMRQDYLNRFMEEKANQEVKALYNNNVPEANIDNRYESSQDRFRETLPNSLTDNFNNNLSTIEGSGTVIRQNMQGNDNFRGNVSEKIEADISSKGSQNNIEKESITNSATARLNGNYLHKFNTLDNDTSNNNFPYTNKDKKEN